MPLPISIPAVFGAARDIGDAVESPLAVSVLIDDTAPGDLAVHVRSAFASAGENVRVTIGYLSEEAPVFSEDDDMAVIVAGVSEYVGAQAAYLRQCGLPVMVATTLPILVGELAQACGDPIPEGDIVAPRHVPALCGSHAHRRTQKVEGADELEEPIMLDGKAASLLDERMGDWIITVHHNKRLAFAHAFPFARRPLSLDSVNATSLQNAAVGLVMFIPGADMPIMTLNQAKMILQIAAAYDQPLDRKRIKEIAAVVGGGFACRGVARTVAGVVPFLGWAVRAVVGFTGTQAMGHAAIDYFEAGGNIAGVASVVRKACEGVVHSAVRVSRSQTAKRAGKVVTSAAHTVLGYVLPKS